jgi:hypothetical protein
MESRIRPARKTRVKYRIERGRSCFSIVEVDFWVGFGGFGESFDCDGWVVCLWKWKGVCLIREVESCEIQFSSVLFESV